ncbi:MAG: tetraacyldisaccharide 4'-kinase [Myxococcota bacterium]|nr:tetraacyldisaccharide 4'-kinase [Myxococcota bacterium]
MKFPWRNAEREGWGDKLLWWPLALPAVLYGGGARFDRWRKQRGRDRPVRVDARVLSVGGLTAGGSGKTPLAAWIAHALYARGTKVALLTRGYRRTRGADVTIASDGQALCAAAAEVGDEAHLLARHASGVPVVVSPDRALAALRAIALYGAEVLVLDDGFQHHGLARDLDLVAIDTASGLGNSKLLPRGPLREPLAALGRADVIAMVGSAADEKLVSQVSRLAPDATRFAARRQPTSLRQHNGTLEVDPRVLRDMKVGLLAGIARPESLRASLEALGAVVIAERVFRDHHRYRARNLRRLAKQADIWITTEKDAGKIHADWVREIDLRVLGIRMQVEQPDRVLDQVEARLGIRRQ